MDSSAPRAGEADRGRGASRRSGGTPAAIPSVAILLLAALALRLIIAYVLFPASGFKNDVGAFTSWALTLAHAGPGGFYGSAGFADYPPGYLYVLWLTGKVDATPGYVLLKLPAILKAWAALEPGKSLRITNDRKPEPLQILFNTREKGKHEWRYEKEGPTDWVALITRL